MGISAIPRILDQYLSNMQCTIKQILYKNTVSTCQSHVNSHFLHTAYCFVLQLRQPGSFAFSIRTSLLQGGNLYQRNMCNFTCCQMLKDPGEGVVKTSSSSSSYPVASGWSLTNECSWELVFGSLSPSHLILFLVVRSFGFSFVVVDFFIITIIIII